MELGSEYNLNLSELWLRENNFTAYFSKYNKVYYTDSGRSAIRCISSRLSKGDTVLIPEYICESVINCFLPYDFSFYKITDTFEIDCDDLLSKITPETKVIFLMHYFGKLQSNESLELIRRMAEENGCVIIEDATHSLFSKIHTIGHYVISSLRKWVPIPKGGILIAINDVLTIDPNDIIPDKDNDRLRGMILKDMFLKGEMDCNTEYREIFKECEDRLDNDNSIKGLSDLAGFILRCIDIDDIRSKRRINYNYLKKKLEILGIAPVLEIKDDECPFVFPIRVPDRDVFRRYLIDNNIYCAVHWPMDGKLREYSTWAVKESGQMISLPIDQRYNEKHMEYLMEVISGYRGELLF